MLILRDIPQAVVVKRTLFCVCRFHSVHDLAHLVGIAMKCNGHCRCHATERLQWTVIPYPTNTLVV